MKTKCPYCGSKNTGDIFQMDTDPQLGPDEFIKVLETNNDIRTSKDERLVE